MNRSKVAKKAVRTRQARRELSKRYGTSVYEVLQLLCRGKSSVEVSEKTGHTVRAIAAYRANMTRGTYSPLLDACNF